MARNDHSRITRQSGTDNSSGPPGVLQVLIVDDDEVNRLVISRFLQNRGCIVQTATDGQKALALLGNEQFDIVLMDISMPRIDGLTLTRQIRKNQNTKNIPVIAVTAYANPEDRERLLAQGMDAYMAKPVNLDELYKIILQLFSGQSIDVDQEGLLQRTAGDREFIAELAKLFNDTSLVIIDEISRCTDPADIASLAHKLKGSAETAGASAVVELAHRVKIAADKGSLEDCHSICRDFKPALQAYNRSLARWGILLPGENPGGN
jgi:CheY-like chemotaxis protein